MIRDSKKEGIVRHSIIVSSMVGIGKLLGFAKQAVIAWAFGANSLTDIYFAADSYIALFGGVQIASIAPSVLTEYIRLRESGQRDRINKTITKCYIVFSTVSLLLIVLNILLSNQISSILGISYSIEQRQALRNYIIVLCPVIIFTSISGISQGILDGNNRYVPSKLLSLFFSISIIVFTLLFHNTLGVKALLFGFLIGYGSHTIYVTILSKKYFSFSRHYDEEKGSFTTIRKNTLQLVVGNSLMDLGHLADKIIASALVTGSVSHLYYGQVISTDLVNAVIVTSIGTVLLPNLTKKIAKGSTGKEIAEEVSSILNIVILLLGLVTGLYILESHDLIHLFFERGNFSSESTKQVSLIAICYAIGFVFIAIREILAKTHYAYQDTLSPMRNGIVGVVTNLLLSILLSHFLGVAGIALATSVSMLLVAILMSRSIVKHIQVHPFNKAFWINTIKMFVALASMLIVGSLLRYYLAEINFVIRMIIVSLLSSGLFITISVITKHDILLYFKARAQ